MNKQEKINKIYEVIADKTLSLGCKVRYYDYYKYEEIWVINYKTTVNDTKTIDDFNDDILTKLLDEDKSDLCCRNIFRKDGTDENEDEDYFWFFRYEKFNALSLSDMSCNNSILVWVQEEICDWHTYNNLIETIGHPVMIWTVLDWIEKMWKTWSEPFYVNGETHYTPSYTDFLLMKWKEKRKQIEDQNIDTIDFIYELTQNAETKP